MNQSQGAESQRRNPGGPLTTGKPNLQKPTAPPKGLSPEPETQGQQTPATRNPKVDGPKGDELQRAAELTT